MVSCYPLREPHQPAGANRDGPGLGTMSDTEQSILELARKRFERFGYRKTTIDEICRDGGISKKTLYRHFRDKEELGYG